MGVWQVPWQETNEQRMAAFVRETFTDEQAAETLREWWDLERPHLEDLPAELQAQVLTWFVANHEDEIVAFWTERALREQEME